METAGHKVEEAVDHTLRSILDDLKKLAPDFPQLSGIKGARIMATEVAGGPGLRTPIIERAFVYSRALEPNRKDRNSFVDKNGCYVAVSITTYWPEDEDHFPMGPWPSLHYQAKDSLRYAVESYVAAERTAIGARFTERVRDLIAARLERLHAEVESEPVDEPGGL